MTTPRVKASEITYQFVDGFAKTPVLHEAHEYVKMYKCILQAGKAITLSLHNDRFEVFAFVRGSGAIILPHQAYAIPESESSYFIPNFDEERVDLHAGSDLEFVLYETLHTEADKLAFHDTHMWLPYFRTQSQLFRYDQACKGPHTESYLVIPSRELGRVLMGITISVGEGTDEKGHPSVHQWNYMLPGTEITCEVDGEAFAMADGDFSFIYGGLDHSHIAAPGKICNYIWFEWFVDPKSVTGHLIPQEYGKNK